MKPMELLGFVITYVLTFAGGVVFGVWGIVKLAGAGQLRFTIKPWVEVEKP